METAKHPGGRPRLDFDGDEFTKLCALYCTQHDIAGFLGCSVETIQKRMADPNEKLETTDYGTRTWRELWDIGRAQGAASLRRKQFQVAHEGNPSMLIWLGKQVLNQRDNSRIEHVGYEGGPMEMVSGNTTAEILAQRIERLAERSEPDPQQSGPAGTAIA